MGFARVYNVVSTLQRLRQGAARTCNAVSVLQRLENGARLLTAKGNVRRDSCP